MKIRCTRNARNCLTELIRVLHLRNYFSSREQAHLYVKRLINELKTTLHLKPKKRPPEWFTRYGNDLWYAIYPKSKRTTWYVLFIVSFSNWYTIHYFTNNHAEGHFFTD